jgi:Flp pilus assembly protein TadB
MALMSAVLAAIGIALLLSGREGRVPDLVEGRAVDRPASRTGAGDHDPGGGPGGGRSRSPAVLHLAAAAGAALAVLLVVPGAWGALAAVVAAAVVWRRSRHWESAAVRRRRARFEDDLPHVVDLMVAALHAGAAPGEALGRVASVLEAPTSEELAVWVSRLRIGADPVTVWTAMGRHPQLGRLGISLKRSAESGAPVVAALTRLAEDLRERRRADVEARVRQVEVKAAVPLGVCLLPSFVLVGVVPLVAGSAIGFLT